MFLPRCDLEGFYKPEQCHEGHCWCVDRYGREFDKSRVSNTLPDCGQYGKLLSAISCLISSLQPPTSPRKTSLSSRPESKLQFPSCFYILCFHSANSPCFQSIPSSYLIIFIPKFNIIKFCYLLYLPSNISRNIFVNQRLVVRLQSFHIWSFVVFRVKVAVTEITVIRK